METNLESVMQKGHEHLYAREWEQAARCFREALLLQPDSPEAEEGWSHAQRGQNAELAYNRGLRFIKQKRWEKGIAQLEQAEASDIRFPDLEAKLEFARQRLKARENESKGQERLDEAEKHLNAGRLVEARIALQEADKLFPQDSPLRENLVKTDTTLTKKENERKQAIDSELKQAQKAFEDYDKTKDELRKVRKRLGALERFSTYREDDVEDGLRKLEEIFRHSPKPKLDVVMPVLAFFLGILTLLFGQGILARGPTLTPTVVIPGIARIEVYINGGQLNLDQQLPSLISGEEVELEVVVLDTSGKRYMDDNLVCKWSVAPLGDKDVGIKTDLCKTRYEPSQEYSSQAVFVEVKGREQQFESSGHISMEFNIIN